MIVRKLLVACSFAVTMSVSLSAFAQMQLRMVWYSDGNEGEVITDILREFEAKNPDIKVTIDQVPFKAINETLPVQLAAGEGPDMARVVDLGGVARYMLDLRSHLTDPAYWEKNFGPFLIWMREPGNTTAIPGFMTQLTVTGPFVNKTLFEQAGVAMPGDKASWDDWARAAKVVADKVKAPFPIAIDRSGHRFLGMAISEGAGLFDAKGDPTHIAPLLLTAVERIAPRHGLELVTHWGYPERSSLVYGRGVRWASSLLSRFLPDEVPGPAHALQAPGHVARRLHLQDQIDRPHVDAQLQ